MTLDAQKAGALKADFLALSAALTGFSTFRLLGTGQAEAYLATLVKTVGEPIAGDLMSAFRAVADAAGGAEAPLERGLRREILSDERLGPVARNLIKLWFVGTWYALPPEWHARHGADSPVGTFAVSPDAFVEGLLWPTVGAGASGAKPLGYGMWATPPRFEGA